MLESTFIKLHVEPKPRWISEEAGLLEAYLSIGPRTKMTRIQMNVGYRNPITLLDREHELLVFPQNHVRAAKHGLYDYFKNALTPQR